MEKKGKATSYKPDLYMKKSRCTVLPDIHHPCKWWGWCSSDQFPGAKRSGMWQYQVYIYTLCDFHCVRPGHLVPPSLPQRALLDSYRLPGRNSISSCSRREMYRGTSRNSHMTSKGMSWTTHFRIRKSDIRFMCFTKCCFFRAGL